jgi:hypothetical protein
MSDLQYMGKVRAPGSFSSIRTRLSGVCHNPYRAISFAGDTSCPSSPFGGCRCVLPGEAVALTRETRARPLDDIGGGR